MKNRVYSVTAAAEAAGINNWRFRLLGRHRRDFLRAVAVETADIIGEHQETTAPLEDSEVRRIRRRVRSRLVKSRHQETGIPVWMISLSFSILWKLIVWLVERRQNQPTATSSSSSPVSRMAEERRLMPLFVNDEDLRNSSRSDDGNLDLSYEN